MHPLRGGSAIVELICNRYSASSSQSVYPGCGSIAQREAGQKPNEKNCAGTDVTFPSAHARSRELLEENSVSIHQNELNPMDIS